MKCLSSICSFHRTKGDNKTRQEKGESCNTKKLILLEVSLNYDS
jgi:hypothetical protein